MMKKLIFLIVSAFLTALYIGYYPATEDAEIKNVFFIKKHPTFQVEFRNIHANDGDILLLEHLTEQERQWTIDYCRYRLGIDTELKTQADVVMCSKK